MKRLKLNRMLARLPQAGVYYLLLALVTIGMSGDTAFTETPSPLEPMEKQVTQGALRVKIADEVVECPLKHTDVKVDISGFIARATVIQTFYNPYDENIEGVYVFPLPHTAAVDAMTMKIGERTIVGVMKRRAEARAIYEQAIQQGQTASLLEQERPNIFTQSVGNIKPDQEIHIEISYVDVLNYDMGTYEFHFPMVVGPRYIPGDPISKKPQLPKALEGKVGEVEERVTKVTLSGDPSGTGWSPDTTGVSDASRITPPVLKPGYRTGHDIHLAVSLDAGVPIQDIESVNHTAKLERIDPSEARVEISPMDAIPNKDFVMKYKVVGEKPEIAVFAHATGPEQRYFMLMVQPKLDAEFAKVPPRELVFLVDVSGSMSGEPMAKVKAAMRHFFQRSKPNDTFQVITFSNQVNKLFETSVSATEENIASALTFIQQIHGGGGTEMLAGIKAVLNAPVDPERVRIVVMLTDGYIGNEEQIIAEVRRRAGDAIRFWTIGIGSSPNRFLIDGVAKQGGGMSGVLDLNTNPKELVTQVVERIHRAQLAHIQMDWKQLTVYETYPRRIPELWAGRPVILFGRYAAGGHAVLTLSGTVEGEPLTYAFDVTLPDAEPTNDVLANVWAGKKIEDLSAQVYDDDMPEIVEEITRIALDYRLMSQYTSFVAVDESEISDLSQQPTPPRRVLVPVPLPEGVDFRGFFGGMEEEPQFFYDLFGPEQPLAPSLGRRRGLSEDTGYAGYGFRGRYSEFAIGDSKWRLKTTAGVRPHAPVIKPTVPTETSEPNAELLPQRPYRGRIRKEVSEPNAEPLSQKYQYPPAWVIQEVLDTLSVERQEYAKTVVAEAQALQRGGHLEKARLRYQHALGLAGIRSDDDTGATAAEAIQTLDHEILKKLTEAHPGLNRKLNLIIRNQPLADAVHTLVNAGDFRLDMVPGSLDDVATLLNLPECRVTYLDLRHATVGQGLEWLLAPYHLTWQVKDTETIKVGTARRMPGHAVWGYNVQDSAGILIPKLDENASPKDVANVPNIFLQTIRTVIDQKDDSGITPGSAVLINPSFLLVYGAPDVHETVRRFLEALKDSNNDIVNIAEHALSKETREDLKALQKLTTGEWKRFAEAREKAAVAKARQRVLADLNTASLHLLAEALSGEIHLEALTRLQTAWTSPQLQTVIEKDEYFAMRSAWCIRTAAQAVPTDVELTALSESVLSKIPQVKVLNPQEHTFEDYLGTLYAVLAHQIGDAHSSVDDAVIKALMDNPGRSTHGEMLSLIAESLLSPSENSDKALQAVLFEHEIYSDDLLLLTCLTAKRRGGQLWQTFRAELPNIARWMSSGHILVLINRLAASRRHI